MNFKIMVTLLLAALIVGFTSVTARADSFGPEFDSLVDLIKAGTKDLQSLEVLDRETGLSDLDDNTILKLQEAAKSQAGIWGDTILEGDYFADGATELDRVVAYVRGGEVIAYRITYSERAWDTSDCAFDGDEMETLFGCTPGRISESSFVSTGLTSFTRDMEHLATFTE